MGASIWDLGAGLPATANVSTLIERHIATAGQTVITFSNFRYQTGGIALRVFLNGQLLTWPDDYAETSSSSITLVEALIAGDEIFAIGHDLVAEGGTNASNSAYTPAGTGAVTTTVQAKLRESVSITDKGAAPGASAADNRTFIQAAIVEACLTGKYLHVPAGTYGIAKGSATTDEAGTTYPSFIMLDNLHILAEPGAVFKLADNQSSNGTPINTAMFFSRVPVSNLSFQHLTIDMNGANNPRNGSNNTFAHILCSGTPSGVAARADNVLIEHCTFKNTPGVTCIGMGQTNTASTILGTNWHILHNKFENNGLDCADHSSIYGWADGVMCRGNTFTANTMATAGGVGGQIAYEVHGSDQKFTHNTVTNYRQGLWITCNTTSDAKTIQISNNIFNIADHGMGSYRESAAEHDIYDVTISDNQINISDDSTPYQIKFGVVLSSSYKASDFKIHGNTVRKTGTTTTSGVVGIGSSTIAANKSTDFYVHNNRGIGTAFGVYMNTNATNGLGRITITDNVFDDLQDTVAYPVIAGVSYPVGTNTIDELTIRGNTFSNGTAGDCDYGIRLENGTITKLNVGPNTFNGMVTADYNESALTVTSRRGTFPRTSYTPTWSSGTAITVGNGTVSGSYIQVEDMVTVQARLLVGSTTTFPGGTLSFTLPFSTTPVNVEYLGTWRIYDATGGANAFWSDGPAEVDGTAASVTLQRNNGLFVTHAAPITLAAGDIVSAQISFRVA